MEGPREQVVSNNPTSPVRRLYAELVALDSADDVHQNLSDMEDSDYKRMTGEPEPRFCEWAYQRLDSRMLVSGLLGTVLRGQDAKRLALRVGCNRQRLEGLAPAIALREALGVLGVKEPALPPPVLDGLDELEHCSRKLEEAITGIQPTLLEDSVMGRVSGVDSVAEELNASLECSVSSYGTTDLRT